MACYHRAITDLRQFSDLVEMILGALRQNCRGNNLSMPDLDGREEGEGRYTSIWLKTAPIQNLAADAALV